MDITRKVEQIIDKHGDIKQFVVEVPNGGKLKTEYNSKYLSLKSGSMINIIISKDSPNSDPYTYDEADYAMSGTEIDHAPKGTRCISFGGLLAHFPNSATNTVNEMRGEKWYMYIRKS